METGGSGKPPAIGPNRIFRCRTELGETQMPHGALAQTFLFVSMIYVLFLSAVIFVLTGDEKLTHRQKWGYALGMIGALPVFLPLYLIFGPPGDPQDVEDMWARARGDGPEPPAR